MVKIKRCQFVSATGLESFLPWVKQKFNLLCHQVKSMFQSKTFFHSLKSSCIVIMKFFFAN